MTAQQLPPLRSRLLGSLYGLAVGDALGAPYEFQFRGGYTPSGEMEESHTFLHKGKPLSKGTWTDDTR
jgi:ADP-ribosyl-[dinitrogen reductase] hydrolase